MAKRIVGWPEMMVFGGGVACLVASTALGSFLAYQSRSRAEASGTVFEELFDPNAGRVSGGATAAAGYLASTHALMWMVFGLGACLALVGLRMVTNPPLEMGDLAPFKPIRDVFEDPD